MEQSPKNWKILKTQLEAKILLSIILSTEHHCQEAVKTESASKIMSRNNLLTARN